jgi:EmrB/QacA subfamily drug resistance transporter
MTTQLLTEPPAPASAATVGAGRWSPLPIVLAGTFMVVLDFFIVNVALPSMQSSLHASSGALEWVVAGYALTAAVFLIPAARLGDRLGRRRMFSLGLALFTVSSLACGASSGTAPLIAARLIQGVAGALLMPNVLSIITVLYSGQDRLRALSAYGMTMGIAAVSGQLIGGVLVQANVAGLGWRSCFLINVPIGLVALALAPRLVPESNVPGVGRLDVLGTSLLTGGLVAIVLPLVEGRQHGWPIWTWLSLAAAPLLLAAFAAHQHRVKRRGDAPLLDLSLFANRTFSAGLLTQLVFWSGQASFFLILALYLQEGRHLNALHSGLVFTILAVAYLAASLGAPALTARHGRRILTIAALVLAAGHATLLVAVAHVGVGGSLVPLVPGLLLAGTGMGLAISPLATIALSSTAPEDAGAATGALSTVQNVGNSLGVALIGVVFFGSLHGGFAHAFELSLAALAAILIGMAGLTRLLPAPHLERRHDRRYARTHEREQQPGRRHAPGLAPAPPYEPARPGAGDRHLDEAPQLRRDRSVAPK